MEENDGDLEESPLDGECEDAGAGAEEGVSADTDTISKWIEKYYEERLDKRDRGRMPGASGGSLARRMIRMQFYLN